MTDRAHARTTDPATSHQAAASVGDLRRNLAAVHAVLNFYGPMSDQLLVTLYQHQYEKWGYPQQSPSGIRSRRAELVRRGLVADTGVRVLTDAGRMATVWGAVR